ncbi:MAG TPA: DSD1 family PLP-dependent enzyme [Steroidobacteraceae bacterium]|jgi:D-serine deaminase-like pyridoxal phosphate-dependent protein
MKRTTSRGRKTPALGPNASLVGRPDSRRALATPALILDLDAFEHNLLTMARLSRRAGLELRPHAKTHKCIELARRQIRAGAVGVSVATLREATVMVEAGIPGVLLTTPVVGAIKIEALSRLVGKSRGFMIAVDDAGYVAALERALEQRGQRLPVLVDIDIGMKRTGVASVAAALELIRRVQGSKVLEPAGLQAYSGRVQHIARAADRARVYCRQLEHLARVIAAAARIGYVPGIVSGGGTGTFDIDRRAGLFTECQCGSYAVMDVEYQDVELFAHGPHPFKTALFVQLSVVSNNHPRWPTLDGGFKCFSMDGPLPQLATGAPAGAAYEFYGDEFGKIKLAGRSRPMKLGDKVEIVTPHCDPTINMHDYYHCVRGQRLVDIWPVDARGSL